VTTIQTQVAQVQSDVNKQGREQVLDWLCSHDYSNQLKINIDLHQAGTGLWFFKHHHFMDWKNSSGSSTLFCPGGPGTGKTVISAQVVMHLQNSFPDIGKPILYIFCDYKMRPDQKIDDLLASLVRQLGFFSGDVFETLKLLCSKYKTKNLRLPQKDLLEELEKALKLVGDTYIIVDALDECDKEPRSRLIKELARMSSQCTIRLLATARGESDIEALFKGDSRLTIEAAEGDIKLYTERRGESFAQDLVNNQDLRAEVVRAVVDASEGM
jgi:Cdc6-like AAA superfamily ATPase